MSTASVSLLLGKREEWGLLELAQTSCCKETRAGGSTGSAGAPGPLGLVYTGSFSTRHLPPPSNTQSKRALLDTGALRRLRTPRSSPTARHRPRNQSRAPAPLTTSAFVLSKKASAKTVTTKMLMMKETKRAMQDSMKKYLLASRTSFLFARFTWRD